MRGEEVTEDRGKNRKGKEENDQRTNGEGKRGERRG